MFQFFLILFPSVTHFCILLQVDNTPSSVSRSGKPIDLFPPGPISSIGHNAPTLATIVHRGVRLKKVTTRRTHTPPTVAASTLAQAFKAIVKPFLFILITFTSATFVFINPFLLLQQTSASAKAKSQGADAPRSSQPKRKGAKGTRAGTKRQKVATPPPPPPASPIPVESSPSPPDVETQQAPSPPHPQEAPEVDEPQQEEPQAEGTSTDVGEQTTGPAGSITSSAVPPIQTSIVPPQGNIFL